MKRAALMLSALLVPAFSIAQAPAGTGAPVEKVVANGGSIRYPRFEVPGRVVLGVFTDPAGNSVGLVEMEDGKAKVP
jgi:predicted enzyme related to lactoylglutathione lyase